MKRVFRLAASMALPLSLWAAVATAQNLNNPNMGKPQGGAIPGPSLAPGNIGGTPGIQVLPRAPSSDNGKKPEKKAIRNTSTGKRGAAPTSKRGRLEANRVRRQQDEANERAKHRIESADVELNLGLLSARAQALAGGQTGIQTRIMDLQQRASNGELTDELARQLAAKGLSVPADDINKTIETIAKGGKAGNAIGLSIIYAAAEQKAGNAPVAQRYVVRAAIQLALAHRHRPDRGNPCEEQRVRREIEDVQRAQAYQRSQSAEQQIKQIVFIVISVVAATWSNTADLPIARIATGLPVAMQLNPDPRESGMNPEPRKSGPPTKNCN